MTHGTNTSYTNAKCRCAKCKKAHAKANRLRNAEEQRKRKAQGFKPQWIKFTDKSKTTLTLWPDKTYTLSSHSPRGEYGRNGRDHRFGLMGDK